MKLDTQNTPFNKEHLSRQETSWRKPNEPRPTRPLFTEPGLFNSPIHNEPPSTHPSFTELGLFNWLPHDGKNKHLTQLIKALVSLHGAGNTSGQSPVPDKLTEPPSITTLAIGEEDGGGIGLPPSPIDSPIFTKALGEDNGGSIGLPPKPPSKPPMFTTLALGEEDGGGIKPPKPPIEPPIATTLTIGEEDGGGIGWPPKSIEPPIATTLAIGEEDGGGGSYLNGTNTK